MLYLVTGTPGAGKTINTIKWVNEDERFKEISNGKDKPKLRQVYYYGIRDLDPSFGWIEMHDREDLQQSTGTSDNVVPIVEEDLGPDPLKWYDLPSGSVIIFDEAYNAFPVRHGSKKAPDHVRLLATHRHKGFDIIMICQKVTGQLDSFIRGLVNHHQNYVRVFGSNTVMRFSWDICQENPNSASAKQSAINKTMRYDKKYFGSYHSADEHTSKVQLPWKQIVFLGCGLITLFVVSYLFYDRVYGRVDDAVEIPVQASSEESRDSFNFTPSKAIDPESMTFSQLHTPDIEGLPWTAPVYKELLVPQSWPRPAACVVRKALNLCTCYSQQGTPLGVSKDFCFYVVDNGFFDWTKPDIDSKGLLHEEFVGSLRPREFHERKPKAQLMSSPQIIDMRYGRL